MMIAPATTPTELKAMTESRFMNITKTMALVASPAGTFFVRENQ